MLNIFLQFNLAIFYKLTILDNQLKFKFEISNNEKYKVDGYLNNIVYTKKLAKQLLKLYYQVLQKSYSKKENIWELVLNI